MSWLSQAGKAVGKGISDIGREAQRTIKKVAPVASFLPGANAVLGIASGVAGVAGALTPRKQIPSRSGDMSIQRYAPQGPPPMPVLTSSLPVGQGPNIPAGGGMQLAGSIVGPLGQVAKGIAGGAIGDWLGRTFGPGTGVATTGSGCGCKGGSNGRDACTGQRTSSMPAPNATLFGGCCPPGRTLRRIGMGRDICIKTPKMNVFNPKALARADSRVTGFARRAAPILKDLGFTVTSTRKKAIAGKRRKRR